MEGKGDASTNAIACASMIDREARTQDDTMDIILEAEVDQIVEMINNILISNSTDAMVDHALRYLENKKAQSNHPRIVGDKWTLADIYTIVFLDAVDKDILANYPHLNLYFDGTTTALFI